MESQSPENNLLSLWFNYIPINEKELKKYGGQ